MYIYAIVGYGLSLYYFVRAINMLSDLLVVFDDR